MCPRLRPYRNKEKALIDKIRLLVDQAFSEGLLDEAETANQIDEIVGIPGGLCGSNLSEYVGADDLQTYLEELHLRDLQAIHTDLRHFLGKKVEADDGRMKRADLWDKYGKSLHFLTLEFEDAAVEAEYATDYVRRNKRAVELGVLAVGLLLLAFGFSRWVTYGFFDEPIHITGPLNIMLYWGIVVFRAAFRKHFQATLFFYSLLAMTILCLWTVFGEPWYLPDFNRKSDHYLQSPDKVVIKETSLSLVMELIILIVIYRLRFAYIFLVTIYGLVVLNGSFLVGCVAARGKCSWDAIDMCEELQRMYGSWETGGCTMPKPRNTCFLLILFLILSYFIEVLMRKDYIQATMVYKESRRSDRLLDNILPTTIIEKLKGPAMNGKDDENESGPLAITDLSQYFNCATIMFADVVGFTTLSVKTPPNELVAMLSQMFTLFDSLALSNGVEKIKTIGDCYMAACGVPDPNPDHAKAMARFSLQILEKVREDLFLWADTNETLRLRAGMCSGPCHAGVIGSCKFLYDVWGDAVNTASRMESHGEPMMLQCSANTAALIEDDFNLEARQPMEIKGKGIMQTYFVLSEKKHAKSMSYLECPKGELRLRELTMALEIAKTDDNCHDLPRILEAFVDQLRSLIDGEPVRTRSDDVSEDEIERSERGKGLSFWKKARSALTQQMKQRLLEQQEVMEELRHAEQSINFSYSMPQWTPRNFDGDRGDARNPLTLRHSLAHSRETFGSVDCGRLDRQEDLSDQANRPTLEVELP
eukprot:GEMP01002586.1.p1 GENE.GEMP01002586.1~~GEMP01002586.1.p1  ORF type:complete len:760 (+),score=131.72 GEMP01002586.1:403-2682(+)